MDKKMLDVIIEVDSDDMKFRKLYRGLAIQHIINHPETIEICISEGKSILDERMSILKVKGLKIIIE